MSAMIIAANATGPLPVLATFDAPMDGAVTFLFSGTAWSTNANQLIGVQVLLDGVVIGFSQLYSNSTSEHKALPAQVMVANLQPGKHKIVFQAMNGNTVTDSNDNFSLALLM
jgi:hypothetical protein